MAENETITTEAVDNKSNSATNQNSSEVKETIIETEAIKEEESSIEKQLKEDLEKLKKENMELKDSWVRERAEFQNYKRRSASEYANAQKDSIKNFVSKLLNPLDNLDRVASVNNPNGELKTFVDGVGMIKRELYSILEKENIFKVSPLNQPFDPMTMEAIAAEESDQFKEEIVIEVYQPGFIIKDTNNNQTFTLRPSRVKVGRPKN